MLRQLLLLLEIDLVVTRGRDLRTQRLSHSRVALDRLETRAIVPDAVRCVAGLDGACGVRRRGKHAVRVPAYRRRLAANPIALFHDRFVCDTLILGRWRNDRSTVQLLELLLRVASVAADGAG